MADHDNRTVICSVAFVDIVEYSKKSVEEQMRVKEQLNVLLVEALADIPTDERIILDTGDGVAISFLGNPEESLFFALALRDKAKGLNDDALKLRTGINLGPVRLVRDINGQPNIIGDGINVAQRIMSFANVGQALASRPFFDVISALSPDYARLFSFEGARTDKHVREHEVYALSDAPAPQRAPRKPGRAEAAAWRRISNVALLARAQIMRRPPLATALTVALILATAVALRVQRHSADVESTAISAAAPTAPPVAEASDQSAGSGATQPPSPQLVPAPTSESVTQAAPNAPPARDQSQPRSAAAPVQDGRPREPPVAATGTLRLQIVPWGEVYVNGEKLGVAPPLRDIPLKAGTHRIEIRNPGFPPYDEMVAVTAGEQTRIQHRFR